MQKGEDMRHLRIALVIIATLIQLVGADASVTEYTIQSEWITDADAFSTIDFTGFPNGTFITAQYIGLGVLFADGDDNVGCCSDSVYPQDGAGLDGNVSITLIFTTPITSIAAHFPGGLRYQLFSDEDLIYTSSDFAGSGFDHFAGLVSTEAFDVAVLTDWQPPPDQVFIRNLYFGPPIPAPGAIALLALHLFAPTRRRRR